MFWDALMASFVEDAVFVSCSLAAMVVAILVTFFCFRGKNFNYYSEFSKVFWTIGGVCIVVAILSWCFATFKLQADRVAFNTLKNKAEVRSAIQEDYKARMKAAKTQDKRNAIKEEYKNNGFDFSSTGELVVKETSRVKKDLLDWLNIRDRMEKNGNCTIKIPGVNKTSSGRPSLNDKLNAKAVDALFWMRNFRFFVWSGVIVAVGVLFFIAALVISKKGTEEKIAEELEN